MRAALADYNAALEGEGLPALAMGVGIHRGTVVAGVIGSSELVEYGVIGSAVNLASRVQELTRAHAVDILVTAAVRDALDPRFALVAWAAVWPIPTPDRGQVSLPGWQGVELPRSHRGIPLAASASRPGRG